MKKYKPVSISVAVADTAGAAASADVVGVASGCTDAAGTVEDAMMIHSNHTLNLIILYRANKV